MRGKRGEPTSPIRVSRADATVDHFVQPALEGWGARRPAVFNSRPCTPDEAMRHAIVTIARYSMQCLARITA